MPDQFNFWFTFLRQSDFLKKSLENILVHTYTHAHTLHNNKNEEK